MEPMQELKFFRIEIGKSKKIMKIKLPMITEDVCNSAKRVWERKGVRAQVVGVRKSNDAN